MNPSRQRGISLIEILISVTLGLVLTLGLISVFVNSKQGYRVQESRSRMQENSRFAIDYLSRVIRLADFWGSVRGDQITVYGATTYPGNTAGSACSNAWLVDPLTGIRGYDGGSSYPGNSFPVSCFSNYVANSDVLTIRYADPDDVATTADLSVAATQVNGRFFLRTLLGKSAALFDIALSASRNSAISVLPDASSAPGAVVNYRFRAETYYLGNFNTTTPALYYNRNLQDATEATPLVDGIEMMQLEYGLDTNGDLLVDRYQAATAITTSNAWSQVLSVRVNLIVRGDALDGFTDSTTYSMVGGASYTPAAAVQRFQRMQVIKEIQIRNRIKAR